MLNLKSIAAGPLTGVAVMVMTATSALSVAITVPTGLGPGTQYRLAFLSPSKRDAQSANIEDYNSFVNIDGFSDTGIDGWKAIVSTPTVDARDNTSTNASAPGIQGVPIYLLDGSRLVDDYDDLWDGTLDRSFSVDSNGFDRSLILVNAFERTVWTGTPGFDGQGLASLFNLGGNFLPTTGQFDLVGVTGAWISEENHLPTERFPLYAISPLLTTPSVVSGPGSLSLLAVGLVGLAVRWRWVRWRGRAGQDPLADHSDSA
jgi:hypothetical protein